MYRTTTLLASIAVMLLAFTTISQAATVDGLEQELGLKNGATSNDYIGTGTSGPGVTVDFF